VGSNGAIRPSNTCQVLLAAGKQMVDAGRTLMYADSGVENVNGEVDNTLFSGCLVLIMAQVEVGFSNPIVEAYWRTGAMPADWRWLAWLPARVSENGTSTSHAHLVALWQGIEPI
jgi:hypothetical protein